jgi:urea transport system permease protein
MSKLLKYLFALALFAAGLARAASPVPGSHEILVRALLAHGPEQLVLLRDVASTGDPSAAEVLNAWGRSEVYLYVAPSGQSIPVLLEEQQDAEGKVRLLRVDDRKYVVDETGKDLHVDSSTLTSVDADMHLRTAIRQSLDLLSLAAPDPDARHSAVVKLGASQKVQNIAVLQARLPLEPSKAIQKAIKESIAQLQLSDPALQLSAIHDLAKLNAIGCLYDIKKIEAKATPKSPLALAAHEAAVSIEAHIQIVNFFGTIFRGLSLGSILLVVALGLAITFGLMGVINMAHGEMIAVGAYTCYIVQNVFGSGFSFAITLPFSFAGKPIAFGFGLPGINATGWFYESYFLFALPLSFLAAALAGLVVERVIIRFLYSRPLESLLATWGVSLFMQQCFRMIFGANNVQVNSPSWLLGHFAISDVLFGYNRVFVIAFAILIVLGTWLLLTKTPLGLLIRSVMQNRAMAACMGVKTERVNMLTFAFGSGLAGLAGAFLSQIGNVGPNLGQAYIVDSFMTVVVGGVGSIVGTVWSALGIGTSDQVLQQLLGSPVLGKIIVLAAIILFLQWKPGGLFTTRSRNLDS